MVSGYANDYLEFDSRHKEWGCAAISKIVIFF